MFEIQKARVESGLEKLVSDVDKAFLRKMEAKMYLCSARCCENNDMPLGEVRKCTDRCSEPVVHAQNVVKGELEYFQNRLQRCVTQCHDDIQHKMSASPSSEEVDRATKSFEVCASQCCDKQLEILPTLFMKISQAVKEKVS